MSSISASAAASAASAKLDVEDFFFFVAFFLRLGRMGVVGLEEERDLVSFLDFRRLGVSLSSNVRFSGAVKIPWLGLHEKYLGDRRENVGGVCGCCAGSRGLARSEREIGILHPKKRRREGEEEEEGKGLEVKKRRRKKTIARH
jgi:hypothetical protein